MKKKNPTENAAINHFTPLIENHTAQKSGVWSLLPGKGVINRKFTKLDGRKKT